MLTKMRKYSTLILTALALVFVGCSEFDATKIVAGPTGPQGPAGEQGEAGVPGDPGPSGLMAICVDGETIVVTAVEYLNDYPTATIGGCEPDEPADDQFEYRESWIVNFNSTVSVLTTRPEFILHNVEIPEHVEELGLRLFIVRVMGSPAQLDEAFGVGVLENDQISWIADNTRTCPYVVPDNPYITNDGERAFVGRIDRPAGLYTLVIRHAITGFDAEPHTPEFGCYDIQNNFETANSVHVEAIHIGYWVPIP